MKNINKDTDIITFKNNKKLFAFKINRDPNDEDNRVTYCNIENVGDFEVFRVDEEISE